MTGGLLICFIIGVVAYYLGQLVPLIGGPVFGILIGLMIGQLFNLKSCKKGITFTSKKLLQLAVIVLGFTLNFKQVMKLGSDSLPIIIMTITTSLIVAYIFAKMFKVPNKIATLIGVGSSICGGSAIAATSSVIDADDQDVAQAISVIFIFNILAALIFPTIGQMLGMSDMGFGLFAGTAINDTSSVTAAASIWDSMFHGNSLEIATIVKLTRTLAIIPITLVLAYYYSKKGVEKKVDMRKIFPYFILLFLLASIITSVIPLPSIFTTMSKDLSKFLIVMAMSAIGLNTNIISLIKSGIKPILLGLTCWVSIIFVSLVMQSILNII